MSRRNRNQGNKPRNRLGRQDRQQRQAPDASRGPGSDQGRRHGRGPDRDPVREPRRDDTRVERRDGFDRRGNQEVRPARHGADLGQPTQGGQSAGPVANNGENKRDRDLRGRRRLNRPGRSERAARKAAKFGGDPSEIEGSKPQHGRGRRGGGKSRSRADKAARRNERPSGRVYKGKVDKNAQGFAFLAPLEAGFDDVYVNRREASSLMDGDIVEFSVQSDGKRSQARIHNVLQRSQNKLIGQLQQNGRHWSVTTQDGEQLDVDPESGSRPGDWVIADIENYPTQKRAGTVQITKRFGQSLEPKNDNEIALARYGIPSEFNAGALSEANAMHPKAEQEVASVSPFEQPGKARFIGRRLDMQHLPLVTIDGEDAKDFDDAILVTRTDKGYILYVAIADVSFFVTKKTALDHDAITRGTSVYLPGTCVPMLPEVLSNDLCSLRPKVPRLALTAEIHYAKSGEVTYSRFYPAVIKTADRLTYTQVQKYLDGNVDAVIPAVRDPLLVAQELYKILDKRRRDRGVLDFDLPECKVLLDDVGFPIRVFQAERMSTHKIIEEFMIAANSEVAKALREADVPALYRVHEEPKPEALDELNELLVTLGIKKKVEKLSPKAFAQVLEGTAELKIAGTLHISMLRLQKQAKYMPEPNGHFGLALDDYTHFTSPIRRYPDLVVHRALKGLCASGNSSDKRYGAGTPEEMEATGAQNSDAERRAMEAERFVLKRKQCWYMERKMGEEFEGVISGFIKAGMFVNIPWMALEGFVPIEFMRTHIEIDEDRMCAIRRPGKEVLHLGDALRIQVTKVSVDEGRITFAEALPLKAPKKVESEETNKEADSDE